MNINFSVGELFEMRQPLGPRLGMITKIENIEGVELIVHTQFVGGAREVFYCDSFVKSGYIKMVSPVKPLLRD